MNYFELYGLPVSFLPDPKLVRERYLALSKQYHPDYYTQATEGEQGDVLEMSAAVNKAFKIFKDKGATLKYVLSLKGLIEEEEKFALPPQFLMEMMELNERIADASMDGSPEVTNQLKNELAQMEEAMYQPVAETIENYREGIGADENLAEVKAYYFKKKYLSRIHEALNGIM